MISGIKEGNGTFGKLMQNDSLYDNLTNATKEMEELLREMKLNPKTICSFFLIWKKAEPFNEENNKNNISNEKK